MDAIMKSHLLSLPGHVVDQMVEECIVLAAERGISVTAPGEGSTVSKVDFIIFVVTLLGDGC